MFIARDTELTRLKELLDSGRFQAVELRGRRRVGKTAILSEFIKGKDAIFFSGIKSDPKRNLENLSGEILRYCLRGSVTIAPPVFRDFWDAFQYVFELSLERQIIFVLDEYPFLALSDGSVPSILQQMIDRYKNDSKLFLVLCGSSLSYMKNEAFTEGAPLYGRMTANIRLKALDFYDSSLFVPNFKATDRVLAYGIVGGIPQYLLQLNDRRSIRKNIEDTFLNPTSFLYEEPEKLLSQEDDIRDIAPYSAVCDAIASGASKLNDIATRIGKDTSQCSAALSKLTEIEIVRKEVPLGEPERSRRTLYSLQDNMFRFWYRYVPRFRSLIERRMTDEVSDLIDRELPDFMGRVFEDVSADYLWRERTKGRSPVAFAELSRWWGGDPKTKKQAEIDRMGYDISGENAVFCECKWRNEKTDLPILEDLIEKSRIHRFGSAHYYLFSKAGFTPACEKEAVKRGNVSLVSYEDMV